MTLLQRVAQRLGPARFLRLLSVYPPFLGAGVRVERVDPELRYVDVRLGLHFWNRNFFGTQFGGSLFAMGDPFFAIVVLLRLGDGYVVWDKSGAIEFLKPGRGVVRARFEVSDAQLAALREQVERDGRARPQFTATIVDEGGEAVARVSKVLSVKKRAGGQP